VFKNYSEYKRIYGKATNIPSAVQAGGKMKVGANDRSAENR
jgi:hypothetical protein